jgi:hypothetical protein
VVHEGAAAALKEPRLQRWQREGHALEATIACELGTMPLLTSLTFCNCEYRQQESECMGGRLGVRLAA